jgi:type I restriction-modification system DNA methylase subunit
MLQLPAKIHRNHQLFSDHYLDETLPRRADWLELITIAEPVMAQIAYHFDQYVPSDKEGQIEHDLIRPILEVLGHTFEVQATLQVPGPSQYPDYIFYRDKSALNANKGKLLTEELLKLKAFAVGDAKSWMSPLDIPKRSGSVLTNKNPSYQIAFYIQHSGLDWGILTNGRYWRLYHKNTAHKLDHYYEVDLPALLQSNDVSQFLYFYAFFRCAAFDQHGLNVATILKESYEYAQDIDASLEKQVFNALRLVAQGFLTYPPNHLTADDANTLKDIYDNSLILLYRLLFILYAEARDFLALRESDIYREYYSLFEIKHRVATSLGLHQKLRSNSAKLYNDLQQLFQYINEGDAPLHIATFNGGLFDSEKHLFLEKYRVSDEQLQLAIDMLARVKNDFIDYRDLSVRNLGTIYEGLLEHHLEKVVDQDGWNIDLVNEKGERQATGSYYTPDYIVKYIVEQTVGSVLRETMARVPDDKDKVNAVLGIKVLDPSMGSAHFLVEATEYIARFLVELNAQKDDATKEADLAYWKRRVVQSCIYGVDLNPLAVELAKLSLWLNTVAKDRPLSFLDHHLRTGNAVIGTRLADLSIPPNGTAKKSKQVAIPGEQLSLFDDEVFRQSIEQAVNLMWLVEDNPAQTIDQVKEQEQLYAEMRERLVGKYGSLADLHIAAHYGIAVDSTLWKPLMDFATGRIQTAPVQFTQWLNAARFLAQEPQRRFFHWELEFPEIFFDKYGQAKRERAGFDAVIGNPPWIRQEAFSQDKSVLKLHYSTYSGQADLSTYFVELGNTYLKENGHFGFIIPNKFVRARYGEALRSFLAEQVTLRRIVNFGDLPVFSDTATYPMIVLTSKQKTADAQVIYSHLKQLRPNHLTEDILEIEELKPAALFTGDHWPLTEDILQLIIDKMKIESVPLGNYVENKIFYGIKTGFNRAFVINRRIRDQLIAADPKSAEIIKPIIEGEDVRRYRVNYKYYYIILSKIDVPIERYPAVFAHLQQYQSQLEKRSDRGKHWWELRACDYYDAFEQPKIMWPIIASFNRFTPVDPGYYSNDKTFFIPTNDLYLLAILNSSIMFLYLRTKLTERRGDFWEYQKDKLVQVPIRCIHFTTSDSERADLTNDGLALYQSHHYEDFLIFVQTCLQHVPEQGDVIHDILVSLVKQILAANKQRQIALEEFTLGLESVLFNLDVKKLDRLWTPPPKTDNDAERRLSEGQEKLGTLVHQQLNLQEHIGLLNEEQWKWLIKRRLVKPDLVDLVKIYRKYQPPIAQLDQQITTIDDLINQIVYRLYGLTSEEIALVEERLQN